MRGTPLTSRESFAEPARLVGAAALDLVVGREHSPCASLLWRESEESTPSPPDGVPPETFGGAPCDIDPLAGARPESLIRPVWAAGEDSRGPGARVALERG